MATIHPESSDHLQTEYLAEHYQWALDNAPQLLVEQKNPGDSGTFSTKEAVFSKRIYVYYETHLPAETSVKLTDLYKKRASRRSFAVRTTYRRRKWKRIYESCEKRIHS